MEIHHTVEDKYCYSKIVGTMLETFPEVREQYAKELRWISDTFQGQKTGGQSLYFDLCEGGRPSGGEGGTGGDRGFFKISEKIYSGRRKDS